MISTPFYLITVPENRTPSSSISRSDPGTAGIFPSLSLHTTDTGKWRCLDLLAFFRMMSNSQPFPLFSPHLAFKSFFAMLG
jgi:hypothetical protein